MADATVQPGMYRHFKGNLYLVYGVAERVDIQEQLVIYRPLYGKFDLVARPLSEFAGMVVRDGREMKRFEYVGPPPDDGPASADWNNFHLAES